MMGDLRVHLPITLRIECLAVFDQKMVYVPHPPYSPDLTPNDSFFISLDEKKSSKASKQMS